jgi:hypothetical protein
LVIIRIIAGLINALLKVVATILTSGIGLLVTGLTLVGVLAALGMTGATGFEALHFLRKRKRNDDQTPPV